MSEPSTEEINKKIAPNRQSLEDRFWLNVQKTSDCWLWTGTKTTLGYGQIGVNNKMIYAHRYSLGLHLGSMPKLHVLHSCDNSSCVNPEHLREGTQQDNVNDAVRRNRNARGESHGSAKLSNKDVLTIRKKLKQGQLHKVIAKEFGVTKATVTGINTRRYWKHL